MDIKKILKDLYELDPSLKEHEASLEKILKKLIKEKPDTKFDEKTIKEIKAKILAKAKNIKEEGQDGNKPSFIITNIKKTIIALTGTAAVITIAFVAVDKVDEMKDKSIADIHVSELPKNAFGSLSMASRESTSLDEEIEADGRGAGTDAGGGGLAQAPSTLNSGTDMKMSAESARIMPPAYRINFNLNYEGDEITINESEMAVYKKNISSQNADNIKKVIGTMNFDLASFDKLSNVKLANVNFYEDKKFGYSVNVNFDNNTISIHSNWKMWPDPYTDCKDEKCYQKIRLDFNDIPSDNEIIKIANTFLVDYGINMEQYGKPTINDFWRKNQDLTDSNIQPHIPDSMQVVYPLLVEGKPLSDEGGNETGLYVGVNIRYKKVDSVTGLNSNDYEKSLYDIENNSEILIKTALNGGLTRIQNYEDPTDTVDVKLGTPEIGLMKYYKYNQATRVNEVLYVPALFFPVADKSDEVHFYRDKIVVPLPKELINNIENNQPVLYSEPEILRTE